MFWYFLIIWFVCGVVFNFFDRVGRDYPKGCRTRKWSDIIKYTAVGVLGLSLLALLLFLIGCIWYFFCGGFLLFEDQSFWDKVICGAISVVMFIIVLGGIAVLCGKQS